MELHTLKQQQVRQSLGITEEFGSIHSFVDFANVNYWFEDDQYAADGTALGADEQLGVDLEKLHDFTALFSEDIRFYYGLNREKPGSLGFIRHARDHFGKNRVFTKPIQQVRHYLAPHELVTNTRTVRNDAGGAFVLLPKCNFDVEICVDAIKTAEGYKTFCLFSSDADFVHLARFLKSKGKRVILVKSGHVLHALRKIADLLISAQDIKRFLTVVKKAKPSRNG
jgi:uncharacterized LabA/DUF88 family protein